MTPHPKLYPPIGAAQSLRQITSFDQDVKAKRATMAKDDNGGEWGDLIKGVKVLIRIACIVAAVCVGAMGIETFSGAKYASHETVGLLMVVVGLLLLLLAK